MRHYWITCNKLLGVAALFIAIIYTGCGQPPSREQQDTNRTSAGMKEGCVGMGCAGEISIGLKEKCVGMGCPTDDAK